MGFSLKKKDSVGLGVLIGALLPSTLYGVLYLLLSLQGKYMTASFNENMHLLLIAINGILFRQFMIKWDMDKTGKGMLAVTFIYVLGYVIHYHL